MTITGNILLYAKKFSPFFPENRRHVGGALLTAIFGFSIGAEVVTLSEFVGKVGDTDIILWSDWKIISAALVVVLGFMPILYSGIMVSHYLILQLKLREYVAKYFFNGQPLIKP